MYSVAAEVRRRIYLWKFTLKLASLPGGNPFRIKSGFSLGFGRTWPLEVHDGCTPPTERFTRKRERFDSRMSRQNGVNGLSQLANAFSMDDPNPEDALRPTRLQVIRHEVFDHAGWKGVQIEHAVDRQSDGLRFRQAVLGFCHAAARCKGLS
jgi:hypothetical protein